MTRRAAPEVELGTVWFVWGDHFEVTQERTGRDVIYEKGETYREREVALLPKNEQRRRKFRRPLWVADWRIPHYGEPSLATFD